MGPLDALIFDLDGTLWDTTATCVDAWNRILQRHAIPFDPITLEDMRRVTGRPHRECVETVFDGLSAAHIELLDRETARDDVIAVRQRGGELYPGVAAALPRLRERFPLMIVSNCQAGYIESFLEFSGLGDSFVDHECWGNTGRSKSDNLASVIARNSVRSTAFVGDTTGDERAARDGGAAFIHVSYGFGRAQAPDATIDRFDQLLPLLER